MKAMILAAGLGTRLKPLTDNMPKALVEVAGVPMLQRVILYLKKRGFDEIIINVHHFAHRIKEFIDNNDFGVNITISDESEELLDTGGGIVKAAPLIFSKNSEPVLVHNVDILSNADVNRLMKKAKTGKDGAMLLVSDRNSTRKLIFSHDMKLKGWHDISNGIFKPTNFIPENNDQELAFSGIYVFSKKGVEEMEKLHGEGKYSVMDYFLNPERKVSIGGFVQSDLNILDIGKPATLARASEIFKVTDTES